MSYNVIVKPLITEKISNETETLNKYGFIVAKKANKIEIKKAIEVLYNVTVESVNTLNYGGGKANRKYTNRGIVEQRKATFKKAIVTVADGEAIDLYGNV